MEKGISGPTKEIEDILNAAGGEEEAEKTMESIQLEPVAEEKEGKEYNKEVFEVGEAMKRALLDNLRVTLHTSADIVCQTRPELESDINRMSDGDARKIVLNFLKLFDKKVMQNPEDMNERELEKLFKTFHEMQTMLIDRGIIQEQQKEIKEKLDPLSDGLSWLEMHLSTSLYYKQLERKSKRS